MTSASEKKAAQTAKSLVDVDDEIASCRAFGHAWPSRLLRPGRPLPKGYTPRLSDDGYVEITETCTNGCGKQRYYDLLPGGVYNTVDVVRRYIDPPNWKVIPREDDISKRDWQGEVIRRSNEDILAAARAAAKAEAKAG